LGFKASYYLPFENTVKLIPMYIINFEDFIEPEIVARAKDYLKQNRIEYANNLGESTFKALIKGEQDYDVYVDIERGEIMDYSCNCPYTWGKICKHTVALLFHIREAQLHLVSGSAAQGTNIETVMNQISDRQLRQFVFKRLLDNRTFRDDFFKTFS
jgi:uncharacterized Zn finger protein